MKSLFALFLCLGLVVSAYTQPCPKYTSILQEARISLKKEKYVDALNKLSTAREYCPEKAVEVDQDAEAVVKAI